MQGRAFLDLAREIFPGATEVHWRGVVIHAYYALLLECRDTLIRWGFPTLRSQSVHTHVRLLLIRATDADLNTIGRALEDLSRDRNRASYDLTALRWFASASRAQATIHESEDALALLDQLDRDATRRLAAIAAISP